MLNQTKNKFKDILKGKVVIVGVGNILKGDDGFGPLLIERLKTHSFVCIDAGTSPESYVGVIKRHNPDTIIIADAVHLGELAGTWDILNASDIAKSGFTTHDLSPSLFLEFLKNETNAQIYLLGMQPATTGFGSEVSDGVRKSLNELSLLFCGITQMIADKDRR